MQTPESFATIAAQLRQETHGDGGIGALGEKLLHRTVKTWLQPSSSLREVPMGRMVVDAITDQGVQEIQTRNFYSLTKKLPQLLAEGPVTVVCPLPARKWLAWIDPHTGELSPLRLVGRRGKPWDIGSELVHLLPFLGEKNLTFRLLLIDMEEYRLRSPKGPGKRGAQRVERIPLALSQEVWLRCPQDFLQLAPSDLPDPFTRKELQKATRLFPRPADRLLAVLKAAGAVEPREMRGREKQFGLYRPTDQEVG